MPQRLGDSGSRVKLIRSKIFGRYDIGFRGSGNSQRAFVRQTAPGLSDPFASRSPTDLARSLRKHDARNQPVSVREVVGRQRDTSEFHPGRQGSPFDSPVVALIGKNEKHASTGREVNSVEQGPINGYTSDDHSGKAEGTFCTHRKHANGVAVAASGCASFRPGGAGNSEPDTLRVIEADRAPAECRG
jgi:hypothetical protein